MSKKIAIVLSGCGVKDGSEIHESVLALLAVVKNGAEPVFYAPDIKQNRVVNHVTGDPLTESRNVLTEAGRIARGDITDIKELKAGSADAVIFPGGFGAALNLCDYAENGPGMNVISEVERVIKDFNGAGKPVGVICIAPVLAAKVLGSKGVELTIGNDPDTAEHLQGWGAKHVNKTAEEAHVDMANKVVSTPAYMVAENIAQAEKGISELVKKVIELA